MQKTFYASITCSSSSVLPIKNLHSLIVYICPWMCCKLTWEISFEMKTLFLLFASFSWFPCQPPYVLPTADGIAPGTSGSSGWPGFFFSSICNVISISFRSLKHHTGASDIFLPFNTLWVDKVSYQPPTVSTIFVSVAGRSYGCHYSRNWKKQKSCFWIGFKPLKK